MKRTPPKYQPKPRWRIRLEGIFWNEVAGFFAFIVFVVGLSGAITYWYKREQEEYLATCQWERVIELGNCTNNSWGHNAKCRVRTKNWVTTVPGPVIIGDEVAVGCGEE